jgi:hypothetical protein
LGKVWRVLQLKMSVSYTAFWSILRQRCVPMYVVCGHMEHFMVIWTI